MENRIIFVWWCHVGSRLEFVYNPNIFPTLEVVYNGLCLNPENIIAANPRFARGDSRISVDMLICLQKV